MTFATTQTTEASGFALFFQQYGLLLMLLVLIVFMFWSSRRRAARAKVEQETKARQMVPGVKVLLQGGLYGTLVEFDAEDLSKAAHVELAPGFVVEVHSQAILRVVDPLEDAPAEDAVLSDAPAVESIDAEPAEPTTPLTGGTVPDADDKPKA
ncbi:preprotein translocase subunit YajC [Microbacterium saccharophilum]|uniref:Preprotein translocase subunit YajC n=1 Tax=Microbacterium saccharophilum TaxID=1213358 RepID=A0A5C8HT72_9MICO|nr:preprotein translocase subunit YajC [Microbacterium saccharophilum]TXK09075.1 preprotein translocase subunit YajC [Microbacterium saccharophilum]GEP47762.1 hypothetical protein MSA03_12700 [Microbacterium saccharophilum]